MILRIFVIGFFLLSIFISSAQQLNDTLYFKSGMERACQIDFFDQKNIQYTYYTSKNDTVHPNVKVDQLKYFVVYDSLNRLQFSSKAGIPAELEVIDSITGVNRPDSMEVSKHLLSINPFSACVLGLNFGYTFRFGKNLQYGIHIPVRITSPILFGGNIAFYTGIGFTAFVVNTPKYSMTLHATPSLYYFGDSDAIIALPLGIGFVRYVRPRIAIDGSIAAGPGFENGTLITFPIPAAHIGIAFMPGRKQKILIH